MPSYAIVQARPRVIYADATLIAAAASVNSGYLKLNKTSFIVTKKHTTGTYAMTLDWSNDGTNTLFTTTPTLTDNTPLTVNALAPYVKVTITCTVTQFTVHQTTVML